VNVAVGIIIAVLIIAGWWGYRRYLPDVSCWWCKGTGRRWGSNPRKRSGKCFFCKGSGQRKGKNRK
jgi:hypothetical protein